jgi:hypothetical protein
VLRPGSPLLAVAAPRLPPTLTGPSKSAAEARLDRSFGATTALSSVPPALPPALLEPLEPDFFGRFFLSLSLVSGAGLGFFFFSSWYMLR